MASLTELWLYPLGQALGGERISTQDLVDSFGPVREGFLDRTGFTHVYRSTASQDSLGLALSAVGDHENAWWVPSIDALISVGSTPNLVAPGNGHLLQGALGLRNDVLVLDLNDACTGFVRSLQLAHSLLSSGAASTILLVISDTYSKLYDPSNLKISPLFSDGASAMIISSGPLAAAPSNIPARRWRLLSSSFVSEGGSAGELSISRVDGPDSPLGSLEMNGAGVFNFVLRHLSASVTQLTSKANIESTNVDSWFVHQGSRAVVTAVEKSLRVPAGALFRSEGYGNTVGSSIPFQLGDDIEAGQPKTIGLLAFGVGLTMAGMLVQQLSPAQQVDQ